MHRVDSQLPKFGSAKTIGNLVADVSAKQLREWGRQDRAGDEAASILVSRHRIPAISFGPVDPLPVLPDESPIEGETYRAVLGTAVVTHAVLGHSVSGWSVAS